MLLDVYDSTFFVPEGGCIHDQVASDPCIKFSLSFSDFGRWPLRRPPFFFSIYIQSTQLLNHLCNLLFFNFFIIAIVEYQLSSWFILDFHGELPHTFSGWIFSLSFLVNNGKSSELLASQRCNYYNNESGEC